MQIRKLITAFLMFCASCNLAHADEFVKPKMGAKPVAYDKNNNPIYKLIDLESRFDQNKHGTSPMVYQGTRSAEGEFKEVGFLGFCTATAVGSNLLYTAAHCISNGQKVNWKSRFNQVSYKATCNKHPDYNDRTVFNDYAFCILDEGDLPADHPMASFNMTEKPGAAWEALLNGFGAPNLGTHYWGKAVFDSMQGQDIVTCGPANLGGGDSGGSFFKWVSDRINAMLHEVFATNSRAGGGCSYFNWVGHPNFKPYGESQVQKGAHFVCGVTKDCHNPVDPTTCVEEQSFVTYVKKQLGLAEDALKLCREL